MTRTRKSSPSQAALGAVDWTGLQSELHSYARGEIIFAQGDVASTVLYLEAGNAKLSVVSKAGKEAVVAVLEPGTFFGEGCLAGQARRMATASTVSACRVRSVEGPTMTRHMAASHEFGQTFLKHMLTRNIRVEEDLVDLLFNSSEKRLARALLLLARYGEPDAEHRVLPKLSQEVLAEMVGTTRSRVNFFLNKFRRLGFIEYNGTMKVHASLLTVVLHD
jgi:CRP/FNR family transcriptional regulator, cyclic AMP receptor protein